MTAKPPHVESGLDAFAGLWAGGQICWRVAVWVIIRVEIRGLKALYVDAMRELLGGRVNACIVENLGVRKIDNQHFAVCLRP